MKYLIVILIFLLVLSCEKEDQRQAIRQDELAFAFKDTITVCSFNIQFLGHFRNKDNLGLSNLIRDYDIIAVQELIAPPYDGTFPDNSSFNPDPESKAFFDAMDSAGFEYVMSGEDTGTNDVIHRNNTSTEWWVSFYKTDKVKVADNLPSGFLADDRSNHNSYERVPYAFAFRTVNDNMDFVLISVHLNPGSTDADKNRRREELTAIAAWIDANDQQEKDFIILGDMNIEDSEELAAVTPDGFLSLNDECRVTNTLARDDGTGGKPYDHVMYDTVSTISEIDTSYDLEVVNLIDAMQPFWTSSDPYPGDPYDHNLFKQYYSDHHPIVFRLLVPANDDD